MSKCYVDTSKGPVTVTLPAAMRHGEFVSIMSLDGKSQQDWIAVKRWRWCWTFPFITYQTKWEPRHDDA